MQSVQISQNQSPPSPTALQAIAASKPQPLIIQPIPPSPSPHQQENELLTFPLSPAVKKEKRVKKVEKEPEETLTFSQILYNLITQSNQPEVISWTKCGKAFMIKDTKKLELILPTFFRHAKYGSLQRQLNMYAFTKATKGDFNGCFHHKFFDITGNNVAKIVRKSEELDPTTGEVVKNPNRKYSFKNNNNIAAGSRKRRLLERTEIDSRRGSFDNNNSNDDDDDDNDEFIGCGFHDITTKKLKCKCSP